MNWSVYILLCSDGSFYTGISTNVHKRFHQHQIGRGAKYFRGRKPVGIVYIEPGFCKASASRREFAIKQLKHNEKAELVAANKFFAD